MAEHKIGSMDIEEHKATWGRFIGFWKYFFIGCILLMIFLAYVGT